MHGYRNVAFTCSVYGILALGTASFASQIIRIDMQQEKKIFLIDLLIRHAQTYLVDFHLKKALARTGK